MLRRAACLLGILLLGGGRPTPARAIPGFSRQTDRPCNSCHIIWPGHLRKTGRDFKFEHYSDVSPDYPGGESNTDRLNLLHNMPISARATLVPYASGPSEGPGSKSLIDRLSLFLGGRLANGIGIYSTATANQERATVPAARIGFKGPTGKSYATGVVVGLMEPGAADPFNTLRHNATITRSHSPALSEGEFSLSSSENFGAVAQATLWDKVYVAAGPFRGKTTGAGSDQGLDVFARAAIDHLPGWGDEAGVMIGSFVYAGKEKGRVASADAGPFTYDTSIRRWGIDTQFQTFVGPHAAQLTGAWVSGRDGLAAGVGPAEYDALSAQALYVYGWENGVVLNWDSISTRPDAARGRTYLGFGPVFFPRENIRISVEWRQQIQTGRAGGVPIIEPPHQHSPRRQSADQTAAGEDETSAPTSSPGIPRTGVSFVIDVAF